MAYVKPLKMTERGFSKEIASSEDIQLNKVSALASLEAPALDAASGNLSIGASQASGSVVIGSGAVPAAIGGNLSVAGASSFSGNVDAGNLSTLGQVSAGTLAVSSTSAFTGNITAGNLSASGALGSASLAVSGASAFTGNITAGNLAASGALSAGSLGISGTSNFVGNVTAVNLAASGALSSASLAVSGTSAFTGNVSAGNLAASGALSSATLAVSGTSSLIGNVTAGNISASGALSSASLGVSGVSTFVGNVTAGNVSATGLRSTTLAVSSTSTFSGNVTAGNVSASGAFSAGSLLVSGTSSLVGNVSAGNVSASGAATIGGNLSVIGTSSFTGAMSAASISASAAVSAGSLSTAGSIGGGSLSISGASAFTGNITAGNISASGNVSAGNLAVPGVSSFTGNVTAANLAASGALSAGSFSVSGASAFTGNITAGNLAASGALSAGSLSVSGASSFTGNISAGSISASGNVSVGSILLDSASGRISSLTDPAAAQDAATKAYVDSVAQGLDVKGSVRTIAASPIALSGAFSLNGISLAAGDRVLVVAQTDAKTNGIYVVASGAWARSADMDISAEFAGAFTFVESGTQYADTGWVCTVDKDFVLGTDSVTWVQFSSAGVYSAGDGLSLNGTQFSVNQGDGLRFNSGVLEVDLVDVDPGLEFSAGELQIKLNGSNPALSLASGLSVTLSGTTLAKDASGLKVIGLPSAFQIAGSAVSGNVSAGNLSTLTGGIASSAGNASSLLTLNNVAVWNCNASGALTAGDAVYISAGNAAKQAKAKNSGSSDKDGWVVGVAAAGAADGTQAKIITSGVAAGILAGATAGTPYYLGDDGGMTSDPSTIVSGDRFIMVGVAMNSTDLWVQIRDFGQKA